mgnify:FL=1
MGAGNGTQSFRSAPLVSVVIPIYNAKRYLEACVRSLEDQSLASFELICVDDGSTDGSAELLGILAKQYENLRVLLQEHAGVSAARNAGIEDAVGTYLLFVDADDTVDQQLLELAVQKADACSADMTIFGFDEFYEKSKSYVARELCGEHELYERSFDLSEMSCLTTELTTPNVWRILYRRSLLTESGIRFHEDLKAAEDLAFIYETLFVARRITLMEQRLYHYRRDGEGSITHGERGDTSLRALAYIRAFCETHGILDSRTIKTQLVNLVLDTIWYSLDTAHSRQEFDRIYNGYQREWLDYIRDSENLIDGDYLGGRYRRFFDVTHNADAEDYLFHVLADKRKEVDRLRAEGSLLLTKKDELVRTNDELRRRIDTVRDVRPSALRRLGAALRRCLRHKA